MKDSSGSFRIARIPSNIVRVDSCPLIVFRIFGGFLQDFCRIFAESLQVLCRILRLGGCEWYRIAYMENRRPFLTDEGFSRILQIFGDIFQDRFKSLKVLQNQSGFSKKNIFDRRGDPSGFFRIFQDCSGLFRIVQDLFQDHSGSRFQSIEMYVYKLNLLDLRHFLEIGCVARIEYFRAHRNNFVF